MQPLDELDLAILAELEDNARIMMTELAKKLNSPTSTIRDRIQKLEEDGVISGYTAIINPEKLGLSIKAVIKAKRAENISLENSLFEPSKLLAVTKVQALTGDTDELITVYAHDVEDLKDLIYNKVGSLPELTWLSTSIVLDEISSPLTRRFRSGKNNDEPESA